MVEEQAGAEPDFAARIEAVKALVPEMGATKLEQQSAIERTAVEITAVVDQMHAHDHEQEVLRSLRQSLNESFGRYRGEVAASFEKLTTLENDLNRVSMDVLHMKS